MLSCSLFYYIYLSTAVLQTPMQMYMRQQVETKSLSSSSKEIIVLLFVTPPGRSKTIFERLPPTTRPTSLSVLFLPLQQSRTSPATSGVRTKTRGKMQCSTASLWVTRTLPGRGTRWTAPPTRYMWKQTRSYSTTKSRPRSCSASAAFDAINIEKWSLCCRTSTIPPDASSSPAEKTTQSSTSSTWI